MDRKESNSEIETAGRREYQTRPVRDDALVGELSGQISDYWNGRQADIPGSRMQDQKKDVQSPVHHLDRLPTGHAKRPVKDDGFRKKDTLRPETSDAEEDEKLVLLEKDTEEKSAADDIRPQPPVEEIRRFQEEAAHVTDHASDLSGKQNPPEERARQSRTGTEPVKDDREQEPSSVPVSFGEPAESVRKNAPVPEPVSEFRQNPPAGPSAESKPEKKKRREKNQERKKRRRKDKSRSDESRHADRKVSEENKSRDDRKTRRKQEKKKKRKTHRARRIVRNIILIILIIIAAAAVLLALLISNGKKSMLHHNDSHVSMYVPEKNVSVREKTSDGKLQQVSYRGKSYRYNSDLISILLIGTGRGQAGSALHNRKAATALYLLVMDTQRGTTRLIPISPELKTRVDILGSSGAKTASRTEAVGLAYTHGGSSEKSRCQNTVNAVSRMLYGMPVAAYVRLDMNQVPQINHAVDGVTVSVMENLAETDPAFTLGNVIRLSDSQAEKYVTVKKTDMADENMDTETPLQNRQKQYARAYVRQAFHTVRSNPVSVKDIYHTLHLASATDTRVNDRAYAAYYLLKNGMQTTDMTIPVRTNTTVNKKKLYQVVLDVFYNAG